MTISEELMLQMYRYMVLGRLFEQHAEQLTHKGLIPGAFHTGIGEEATHVGSCLALTHKDYIIPTHRGHVADIIKGADPGRLMAEILGRATGYCGGRGGSVHIADAASNNLGVQAVLSAVYPVAVGAALTQKRANTGSIVLAMFGDGASLMGTFHEALNLSAIWHLPVVWVCVNNQYAMSTSFAEASAIANVADRACAYNMPGHVVDGNDVMVVYETVRAARERALAGDGPTLIECKTYRQGGHSTFDTNPYRPQEEIDAWSKRDPITQFEQRLRQRGVLDEKRITQIADGVRQQVDEAQEFALNSPEPPPEAGVEFVFRSSEVE